MSDQLGCLEKSELVTLGVDESFVELAQQKPNSTTHENRWIGKNDSHSRRWGSTLLSISKKLSMHLTQFNVGCFRGLSRLEQKWPSWEWIKFISRYFMCVEGSLERGGGENDIVWGLNSSPGSHTPDARLFRLLHFHKILELKSFMRKHFFHKMEIWSSKPRMEIYFWKKLF